MAKNTNKYKPVTTNTDDSSMERSITYFNKNVTNFSVSTDKLIKSIDTFTKSVDAFKKSTEEQKKESKKKEKEDKSSSSGSKKKKEFTENKAWANKTQKGLDKFQAQASKLGIDRLQKFTTDVFGKNATKKMTRGMAKFAGSIGSKGAGGGFGAGMMGKAMGGLGSLAGGVLRFAGPIGAIASVAKMAFDFWDGGGWAKTKVATKMLFGNKMDKASDLENVKESLEGTKAMRKLNAEYNYTVPLQLRQQAADDMLQYNKGIEQDGLNYSQGLVKDKLDYEMGLRKDVMQFQFQQAMETLDAEMNKRKDIQASGMSFISQYSTISERALKAIGSSTKQILEGVTKFQAVFGSGVKESFQLSENAQGLAYHFGVGADDVMNMTNLFRLMGKTSAEMAQDLMSGIKAFAKENLLAPQAIFAQIKDAGEDIYKFSSGTAENFVKQAGLLTKMSVSMSQMMKASDSMVLNYKDSIKAEMSLSAMLGKNVNLSEVRARLMSGDQAGAASALKTALGGVDINAMNAFQKQALTQATGMDISALMGLQQGKGGGLSGELKAEQNKGKAFADGALKQDISNAGAKLKLEQEQRAKLLEFEQNQRLIMLTLEQAQRMEGIELEQRYRALIAVKGYKDAKDTMAMEMIKEQASKVTSNLGAGTASSLNKQKLSDAAVSNFSNAIAGVDNSISALISSGAIKGSDTRLADYLSKKSDIISQAGAKDKKGNLINTPQQIADKLSNALNQSFSKEVAAYNASAQERNKSVESWNASTIRVHKTMMNRVPTKDELIEKTQLLGTGNQTPGQYIKPLDTTPIANTLKAQPKPLDATATVNAMTAGNKGLLVTGTAQVNKQTAVVEQQKVMLTNTEYEFKLQKEMVALLGLSAQILNKIMENTADGGDITLYGRSLTQSLLNESRRNYGVARTV